MHLEPLNVEGMPPTYDFDMWVNSTNPDQIETQENNRQHLSIGIWIDAKLQIRGLVTKNIHIIISGKKTFVPVLRYHQKSTITSLLTQPKKSEWTEK